MSLTRFSHAKRPIALDLNTHFPDFYGPNHFNLRMSQSQAEGLRQDVLAKEREKAKEEYERQKKKLISETEKARPSNARFIGQNDSMEDTLKKTTVGLVRLEDFQQRRRELEEAKAREAAKTDELKYVLCFTYFVSPFL